MKIMSNDKRFQTGVLSGGEFAAHSRVDGESLEFSGGAQQRTPEQIADTVLAEYESTALDGNTIDDLLPDTGWVTGDAVRELVREAAETAAREARVAPEFKAAGEQDKHRDAHQQLVNGGGDPVRLRFTAPDAETSWFTVTSDQAQRILAILSSETAA